MTPGANGWRVHLHGVTCGDCALRLCVVYGCTRFHGLRPVGDSR